jgi:dimeric dUTPase (all-alpha-NTP-PPase superfamily)
MNLDELFAMQRELDTDIVKIKGLEGQDLLTKKILALQVELGELCQEWRGFKFWSEDQEPRTSELNNALAVSCGAEPKYKNPLLEEYVDCLHFILSIGIDIKIYTTNYSELVVPYKSKMKGLEDKFLFIGYEVTKLYQEIRDRVGKHEKVLWIYLFNSFAGLGELLGFTWEEVVQAYYDKNKINFERQANGY